MMMWHIRGDKNSIFFINYWTHRPLGGWSYRFAAVRPSVRPFVRYQLSSETNHRISLIFCIKLAFNKSKKVTKPDFQKKLFGSNLGKQGPNLTKFEVFGQLFKFESLNFSNFAYFKRQTWCLNVNGGPVVEKNFRAKFGPRSDLSPNYFLSPNSFLDCFSSEFLYSAYYDRQQWCLADSGSIRSQKIRPPYRAF